MHLAGPVAPWRQMSGPSRRNGALPPLVISPTCSTPDALHRATYVVLNTASRMPDMGLEPCTRTLISSLALTNRLSCGLLLGPRTPVSWLLAIPTTDYIQVNIASMDVPANHRSIEIGDVGSGFGYCQGEGCPQAAGHWQRLGSLSLCSTKRAFRMR